MLYKTKLSVHLGAAISNLMLAYFLVACDASPSQAVPTYIAPPPGLTQTYTPYALVSTPAVDVTTTSTPTGTPLATTTPDIPLTSQDIQNQFTQIELSAFLEEKQAQMGYDIQTEYNEALQTLTVFAKEQVEGEVADRQIHKAHYSVKQSKDKDGKIVLTFKRLADNLQLDTFTDLKAVEFTLSKEYQRGLQDYLNAMELDLGAVIIEQTQKVINREVCNLITVTPDETKLTDIQQKHRDLFISTPIFIWHEDGWRLFTLKELGVITQTFNGTRLGGYGFHEYYDQMVELQKRHFNYGMVSFTLNDFSLQSPTEFLRLNRKDLSIGLDSGMKIIGHNLIWPDKAPVGTTFDDYIEWVKKIIRQFPEVSIWEVVNEPKNLTNQQIIDLYEVAREANPDAVLVLSHYGNHSQLDFNYPNGNKTNQMINLTLLLGDRINAVGAQMILFANRLPTAEDVIETLQAYGKPVIATEYQIIMTGISGTPEERLLLQAELYSKYTNALLRAGVKQIVFFKQGDLVSDFTNDKSLPGYSEDADPTLFDDNFKPKPSYYSVLNTQWNYYSSIE